MVLVVVTQHQGKFYPWLTLDIHDNVGVEMDLVRLKFSSSVTQERELVVLTFRFYSS